MSLVHDERKARLIRLGAQPCPRCKALESAAAEKSKTIELQNDEITRHRAVIKVLETRLAAMAFIEKFEKAKQASTDPEQEVPERPAPSIDRVIGAVASRYNVSCMDIISARRTANLVRPRQVAMYLARVLTRRSLPTISRKFGDRDHTTAMHAVRKINQLKNVDEHLALEIEVIKASLLAVAA